LYPLGARIRRGMLRKVSDRHLHLLPAPKRVRRVAGMYQPTLCTAVSISRDAPASVHEAAARVAAIFLRQFGTPLEITHAVAPASEEIWLQLDDRLP